VTGQHTAVGRKQKDCSNLSLVSGDMARHLEIQSYCTVGHCVRPPAANTADRQSVYDLLLMLLSVAIITQLRPDRLFHQQSLLQHAVPTST